MFEEIAPGVFAAEHSVVDGKNGIVFGDRITLAIDAGMHAEEGEAMAAFIRERGGRPDRLALTHGHGDHALGSGAFRGGEVFAHAATETNVRRQLERRAAQAGGSVEQLAAGVAWPTVAFAGEMQVDLGGRTARLFSAPGHSPDSACVFLEEDRILFGGDTTVTGIPPAFGNGDGRELEATLRRLADLNAETLVPGHGPVLRGREQVREWLAWLSDYIAGVRQVVRNAIADSGDEGRDHDAALRRALHAAPYERFIGDRLPAGRHGMPDRHRATIVKIVQEELG
jgi:glyoxylase-like metal-dependent hydrolase (beta-lactamase superfamily II)